MTTISNDILAERHLNELHVESGITIDVILERGYQTIWGKQPLEKAGFNKNQRRAPGYLLPGIGVDGQPIHPQYKPDNPRMNSSEKNPKPVKYETPADTGLRLNTHPRCVPDLGNPEIPLIITEGTKKVDACVTHGLCAIGINGVFGYKGRNEYGAPTFLADWNYVALKGRNVYLAFDSDIVTKPQVNRALEILMGLLTNKGAQVQIIILPDPDGGGKTGVDDYLSAGHTKDELLALAVKDIPGVDDEHAPLDNTYYGIHEGQYYRVAIKNGAKFKVPLCNFAAFITDEEILDDGVDIQRRYTVDGELANGRVLPTAVVPAHEFHTMNWTHDAWGASAIIYAGNSNKDHVRTIMQINRNGHQPRHIYGHLGWREHDGERVYLTPHGAIGTDKQVIVDLGHFAESGYSLPFDNEVPVEQAVQASLEFLELGPPETMMPIWAMQYLAPLTEILNPAFVLWYLGHTGSFKSVITSLALCHYGDFTHLALPLSWGHGSTAKGLSRSLAILKDYPTVVDDWAPAPSTQEQRRLEQKAEDVIRSIGNRAVSTKLRADSKFQKSYSPRGVVISSGEQLPAGESLASRIFVADIERPDINTSLLSVAQGESYKYKYATADYTSWLKDNWDRWAGDLPARYIDCRDRVTQDDAHARLPAAVACLFVGADVAFTWMLERGYITDSQRNDYRSSFWDVLTMLAARHALIVNQERPARRFLEAFRGLDSQGRLIFIDRDYADIEEAERKIGPNESFGGWADEDNLYLIPSVIYKEVVEYFRGTTPLTIKAPEIWKDLRRLGLLGDTVSDPNRAGQAKLRVGSGGSSMKWVIPLKRSACLEN
ncbi:MAG: DUF3854 domain-containing protein [Dehalococcoidia bacterium]